jgi:hypothetical protein
MIIKRMVRLLVCLSSGRRTNGQAIDRSCDLFVSQRYGSGKFFARASKTSAERGAARAEADVE